MVTLQKIGKSFMLPIALLPAAGILLGIGGSFTNQSMVEAYGWTSFLGEGTFMFALLSILRDAGDIVFANLPVLFAIGIAVGMAKKEQGAAALAAFIGFIVMHVVIAGMTSTDLFAFFYPELQSALQLSVENGTALPPEFASVIGISGTLQMGVFGGIISGLITVFLHNRYIDAELPEYLGFFGGQRLIPILALFAGIILGMIMAVIWPFVASQLIEPLSDLVVQSNPIVGSFIFGVIERSLIPFGLHHVFYVPLWQTSLGGTYNICGEIAQGTQIAFFAALDCKEGLVEGINQYANQTNGMNLMSGKFPFMIFGLPGAAFAMYQSAMPKHQKTVGSLLLGAAFTAALTGITEPLEFTFLFVAPGLYYGFHVFMAGLSFALMAALDVTVGMTFSGGIIDLTLFGILPGLSGAPTNWIYVLVVGIPYFFAYWIVFKVCIAKFNLGTPGRSDEDGVELMDRAKVNASKNKGSKAAENALMAEKLIVALGGDENIVDIDACITRLRITIKDDKKVADDATFKKLNAAGVVRKGKAIQVIYGAKAAVYKSAIIDIIGQ